MKKYIISFLVFLCFYSCSNSDVEVLDLKKIDIVTGIYLIDEVGNNIGQFGNPNDLINASVAFYPNPAVDRLNVKTTSTLKNIWIIKAIPTRNYSNIDFKTELNSNLYSKSEIENTAIHKINNVNTNNLQINLVDFKEGFYRVFLN